MLTMAASPTAAATHYVVLNDPRRFGWVDLFPAAHQDTHKLLRHMGPEPLGNAFSAAHLQAVFSSRQGPVKNALLNQQLIAGIGNIYASEALFHAGISPRRKAATIKGQRAERLAAAVVKHCVRRSKMGHIARDHVQPGGEIGYFVQRLAVYGRDGQACQACTTQLK